MERVRIRITLGSKELAFEGTRAVFERTLDGLVEAALWGHFGAPLAASPQTSAPTTGLSRPEPSSEGSPGQDDAAADPTDAANAYAVDDEGEASLLDPDAILAEDASDEHQTWPAPEELARTRREPARWAPRTDRFAGYLKQVGPRATTPEDQALAFAFYLYQYERMDSFGLIELEGCFDAIGLEVPEDLPEIVRGLTEMPRLLEVTRDGGYTLSGRGIATVKRTLLG